MERTKTQVIGTPAFELYKGTNHIDNIQSAQYLLYRCLRNHEGPAIYGRQAEKWVFCYRKSPRFTKKVIKPLNQFPSLLSHFKLCL